MTYYSKRYLKEKSALIIDTPTNCFECPCFMDIGWRCQCRLDIDEDVHDGIPDWCPLVKASTIEAIPIEWIEKKLYCCDNINAEIFVKALIREWEKENEELV